MNNNRQLLESLKNGDREAVASLYRTAFPYCSSIVIKNNGNMDDARDIFQEALIVLYKNLRKEDFKLSCNIKTYLYSVMRKLWLKSLRTKSRSVGYQKIEDDKKDFIALADSEIEHKKEMEEKHQSVALAINKIKSDCKDLLMNFYYNKMALKDIAVLMGYTNQFVKVKKNRCMESLKKEVRQIQNNM